MIGDVHLISAYFGEKRNTAHQIYKNNQGLWQRIAKIARIAKSNFSNKSNKKQNKLLQCP